ncbi:6-phosphogluconolactonase [Parapedobacter soli]|uniref:6-phosphogluconolactonase n=1 Tax=Parapedobacter soli TaxID=416955 RepID=UPI0021CA82B5|nr:6-phosphogluconolactonase [Parapedobacter soli]
MLKKFNALAQLNEEAAQLFVQTAQEAIEKNGRFTVALTGGSSPVELYKLLTKAPYRDAVDWAKVFVFWGDERWVPLTDDLSNARMAFETLLDHVPVPKEQIFPMWADNTSPADFARTYEQLLHEYVPSGHFDLVLLGMGADGHTASWFPKTGVLHEYDRWVAAYFLDAQDMYRITLTVPLINQAAKVAVIAYGANKAEALYEVLRGERNIEQYPAQLIDTTKEGRVTWFVDDAAAAKI